MSDVSKPTRRFRLKAGLHTSKPDKTKPVVFWKAGDIVETDVDLVAKCGAEKFVELSPKTAGRKAVEVELEDDDLDDLDTEPVVDEPKPVDPPKPLPKPNKRK